MLLNNQHFCAFSDSKQEEAAQKKTEHFEKLFISTTFIERTLLKRANVSFHTRHCPAMFSDTDELRELDRLKNESVTALISLGIDEPSV